MKVLHFPPPLIYLGSFALGVLLECVVPLSINEFVIIQNIGWAIAIISAIVAVLGFMEFRRAKTSMLPNQPASAFITTGVFRISRNPLYLSMLLLYFGASLFLEIGWALILSPVLIFVMNRFVIAREERYLSEEFGDSYREYCEKVRRWF